MSNFQENKEILNYITIKSQSKPSNILIMLHGYGSSADDLKDIGLYYTKIFPELEIIIPNGISKCSEAGIGYEWFSLENWELGLWKENINPASKIIINFINQLKEKYHLESKNFILLGFSQGTMLSLDAGIKSNVNAIIGFSGLLVNDNILKSVLKIPNILLIHGDADNVVPISSLIATKDSFDDYGFDVETFIVPRLDHNIDMKGLERSVEFIKKVIK